MIQRMPGDRCAPTFNRVSKDNRRSFRFRFSLRQYSEQFL